MLEIINRVHMCGFNYILNFVHNIIQQKEMSDHNTNSDWTAESTINEIKGIQAVTQQLVATIQHIKDSSLDARAKDVLIHLAMKRLDPSIPFTSLPPPITISGLVHEFLGYLPKKVGEQGFPVSKLFINIGRSARAEYLRIHGQFPPKKVTTIPSGEVVETNNYTSSDKGWLVDVVRTECANLDIHPRPTVAMARGEPVHNAFK